MGVWRGDGWIRAASLVRALTCPVRRSRPAAPSHIPPHHSPQRCLTHKRVARTQVASGVGTKDAVEPARMPAHVKMSSTAMAMQMSERR